MATTTAAKNKAVAKNRARESGAASPARSTTATRGGAATRAKVTYPWVRDALACWKLLQEQDGRGATILAHLFGVGEGLSPEMIEERTGTKNVRSIMTRLATRKFHGETLAIRSSDASPRYSISAFGMRVLGPFSGHAG